MPLCVADVYIERAGPYTLELGQRSSTRTRRRRYLRLWRIMQPVERLAGTRRPEARREAGPPDGVTIRHCREARRSRQRLFV